MRVKTEERARLVAEQLAREHGIRPVSEDLVKNAIVSTGLWRSWEVSAFLRYLVASRWLECPTPGIYRIRRLETDDEELVSRIRKEVEAWNAAVDLKALEAKAFQALRADQGAPRKTRKRRR